jgi:hypothetical protein
MSDTLINTTECRCSAKQPLLICFYCWWKGVRPADRLAAPDPNTDDREKDQMITKICAWCEDFFTHEDSLCCGDACSYQYGLKLLQGVDEYLLSQADNDAALQVVETALMGFGWRAC